MKKSKKRIIEKYVNLRCKKLQEQSLWDKAKKIGSAAIKSSPAAMMIGMATKPMRDLTKAGVETYKDYKAGDITKDQAWSTFGNKALDTTQTSLDAAGMIPAVGAIPDLVNATISQARASATDDPKKKKEYNLNRNLSLAAAIPVVGQGAGAVKLAKNVAPNLAKGVNTMIDVSKQVKGSTPFKTFKYGSKGYKADQKGHITGKEGQVTDFAQNQIVNPAIDQVNQAGPTKFFRNMYNQMKNPAPAPNKINMIYQDPDASKTNIT